MRSRDAGVSEPAKTVWRVLAVALTAGVCVTLLLALLTGCDDRKRGTLVCKDGTVTGGQGAHEVCAEHGGVRGH